MAKLETDRWQNVRLAVMGTILAVLLVLIAFREPKPGDQLFLIVRWPVWIILGLGIPFILIRILLWNKFHPRRDSRGE